uniref:NIPSNAP domain-containing protein n=1 Tax=Acrobeloides nanus TaxID=290746 RepID=A0A914CUZ5_9BILA
MIVFRSAIATRVGFRTLRTECFTSCRSFADSGKEKNEPSEKKPIEEQKSQGGWISRILTGTPYNPEGVKQSHSSLLAVSDAIYELQTQDSISGQRDQYLAKYKTYANEVQNAVPGLELFGSWIVLYGNQDQAVHLWKYTGGYTDVNKFIKASQENNALRAADKEAAQFCRRRRNVLTKPFSYWGDPKPRDPSHIYDLRSYVLKPGTMIEWGNAWAKGITYRRDFNQDVGGFFAQVGQLYMVFHIWAYKDMIARNETRQQTWSKPGWDNTVAYTVPLLSKMQSKILIPNEFSKLK